MVNIEDQGILKLVQKEGAAFMHYLKNGDVLNTLTLGDSGKVIGIKNDGVGQVGFTMKPTEFFDVEVSINDDKAAAKELFDKMLDLNFTHFKTYSEDIVILEIKLKK